METNHIIDVLTLDAKHRSAIEDLIGAPLQANQRLLIGVTEIAASSSVVAAPQEIPSIENWTNVYDGLTETQINEIDAITNVRADLTRNLP